MTTTPKPTLDEQRDALADKEMASFRQFKQNDHLHSWVAYKAGVKKGFDSAIAEMQAEIERLVSDINNKQEMYEDAVTNINALEAENKKLREALEKIKSGNFDNHDPVCECNIYASKALEGK